MHRAGNARMQASGRPARGTNDAAPVLPECQLASTMKPLLKISLVLLVAIMAGNRIADALYGARAKLRRTGA